jgi:hypothetical protein
MESQVKSQISNKLYVSQLEKIEEDDRDVNSELYMIPVSGYNIRVAPGKSIMDESGIAYCYVYVIQQDKVVCKLGVYEKKSDTMPMIFDLSTFPEGSLLLFEEYEMNPSKLIEFKMEEKETETNNVFDYLIRELFPKIQDKRNTLKKCYSLLYGIFSKDDQDKDMKPILKMISATIKEKVDPNEAFLQTLKEKATDKTKFALTLLALQSFFNVEFQFNSDEYENVSRYEDLKQRWQFNAPKIIEVNIDTYEMVEERDKDKLLSAIPEETSVVDSVPATEIVEEPVQEPVEEEEVEPVTEPLEEIVEPVEEPAEVAPLEETVEEVEESEGKVSRPAPVRKGRTPKIGVESKTVKKERRQTPKMVTVPRGTSMNTVIQRPSVSLNEEPPTESISLNDEPSVPETKKTRKKTATTETGNAPAKIKIKRISKPKSKSVES